MGSVVGLDERVLGRVLRLAGVGDVEIGDAERELLVCTHKLLIGLDVVVTRPLNERCFVQVSALHGVDLLSVSTSDGRIWFPAGTESAPRL
jgi:hypothetical protein